MRILPSSRRNLKQSNPLEGRFGSRLRPRFVIYDSVDLLCNHHMYASLCAIFRTAEEEGVLFFGQLSFGRKTSVHARGSIAWGVFRKVWAVANCLV